MLAEQTFQVGSDQLLSWAANLDDERLWASRIDGGLTRWLERQLLAAGEELGAGAAEADGTRTPPRQSTG